VIKIKDAYLIDDGKKDIFLNFGEGKIIIEEKAYTAFGLDYEQMQDLANVSAYLYKIAIEMHKALAKG